MVSKETRYKRFALVVSYQGQSAREFRMLHPAKGKPLPNVKYEIIKVLCKPG